MNAIIELKDIKRDFLVGNETVHALRGVSFAIQPGEFDDHGDQRIGEIYFTECAGVSGYADSRGVLAGWVFGPADGKE